ncbi:choice-of-anchor D domain-containing protein [Streptosporangium sp. NPDC002544]|uniref:choice-of-anchor D domain-containing protein n=1 Tax=Streptosporangium sp. NPDC002544 TaxID=3154538 RepID=UPI0033304295
MVCVPDGYIRGGDDFADHPWSNWARTIRLNIPRWLCPASLTDLVDIVRQASATGVELHALGSGWAFEDVALSRDWMVNLDKLNKPLTNVVDAALTDGRRAAHDGPGEEKLFHVEAGIKIVDLNEALDAAGLAMITLGGANGQSLAGALSTSTHGGDVRLPPIADLVQAIHLVTVGGQEVWIERASAPVTTDERLRPVLPCGQTRIRRDDDLFNAALVACGRFGVIYSVVLKVRPRYRLAEHTTRQPVSSMLARLLAGVEDGSGLAPLLDSLPDPPVALNADLTAPSRFLQVAFTSLGQADCWITQRWPTADPEDLHPVLPRPWCGHVASAFILLGAATALEQEAGLVALIPLVGVVWAAQLLMRANELKLAIADNPTTGEATARAVTAAWESGLGIIVPKINEKSIADRLDKSVNGGRRGPSHLIMTGGREEPDCFRGLSTELIFPGHTRAYLDYLARLISAGDKFQQAGYISLRFSAPSGALLSMHNLAAPYVVSIEVACLAGLPESKAWMEFAERSAKTFGGRPHWGQGHHLTADEVRRLYPEATLERWREALRGVSGTARTFSNAFTRRCGLEPAAIPRAATVGRIRVTTGPFAGVGAGSERVYSPDEYGNIEVDLGDTDLGESRMGVLSFANVGAADLQVGVAALEGDWGPADIRVDVSSPAATGETTKVVLLFSPSLVGPVTGQVILSASAAATPRFRVGLRGSGHGPDLTADHSHLDFGEIEVGGSGARTLRLHNSGDREAQISGLAITADSPGDFEVRPEGAIVPPGQSADLTVTYTPTRPGPTRANLVLYLRRGPGHRRMEVTLGGMGIAPVAVVVPDTLVFPGVPIRRAGSWQGVEIFNQGTAALRFGDLTFAGDFEAMLTDTSPLAPGRSRTLLVRFRPTRPGPRSGAVLLTGNTIGDPPAVSCTGTGLAEPLLVLDPPDADFGTQPVGTVGAIHRVRLANDGVADLHVVSVHLAGAHPGDFAVAQPVAGLPLAPEAWQVLGVLFLPTATGSRSAELVVTSDAFGSPHVVPLTGHGIPAPALTVTPTALDFAATPAGEHHTGLSVTVVNNGAAQIELVDIQIVGADDFAAPSGVLPVVVPIGGRQAFDVGYAPRSVGDHSAELVFRSAAGDTATVTLRGTGTGASLVFDLPETDFGLWLVGANSELKEVTLTNTGNVVADLGSLVIEGDFFGRDGCAGLPLGPGRSCAVRVRFRPSGVGIRTGAIVVSDLHGGVHRTVLRGIGGMPVAAIQPSTMDLGTADLSGAEGEVVVSNTGAWPLTLHDPVVTGPGAADFTLPVSGDGAVVAAGSHTTIRVRFVPSAAGERTALLRFTSNAAGSPHEVALRGTGLMP